MDTVNVKTIGTAVAKVLYASLPTDDMYLKMSSGQKFSIFPTVFLFSRKRRVTYSALNIPVHSYFINIDARD